MHRPTTIQIPEFTTAALRTSVGRARRHAKSQMAQHDVELPKMFQMGSQSDNHLFPMIAISVGKPIRTPHSFQVFHTEFGPFEFSNDDPQISCHMIGHVRWDDGEQALVSIRWRFNLGNDNQTNAYVSYL